MTLSKEYLEIIEDNFTYNTVIPVLEGGVTVPVLEAGVESSSLLARDAGKSENGCWEFGVGRDGEGLRKGSSVHE